MKKLPTTVFALILVIEVLCGNLGARGYVKNDNRYNLDSFFLEFPEYVERDTSLSMDLKRLMMEDDDTFGEIVRTVLSPYLASIRPEGRKTAYACVEPHAAYIDYIVHLISSSEHYPFKISADTILDAIGYIQHDSLYVILDKSFRNRVVVSDEPSRSFNLKLKHNPAQDETIIWWFRQDSASVRVNVWTENYWQDERMRQRILNCLIKMDEHDF